jgi:hypothetical protein
MTYALDLRDKKLIGFSSHGTNCMHSTRAHFVRLRRKWSFVGDSVVAATVLPAIVNITTAEEAVIFSTSNVI